MAAIVIGYNNRVDAATLSQGSWNATYPLNNLKDPNFGKFARSSGVGLANTRFRADLGGNYFARAIALAGHNLSAGSNVRFRFGTAPFDIDFTSGEHGDSRIAYGGPTSSTGSYVTQSGLVALGAAPRITHDQTAFANGFLHSEDLTQTAWLALASGGTAILDSQTVYFGEVGGLLYQSSVSFVNDSYTISGWVRCIGGDGTFKFRLNNGSTAILGNEAHVADGAWRMFTSTIVTGQATDAGNSGLQKVTAAGTLQVKRMQIERGSAFTRYRKTTTTKLFQRRGYLVSPARTNSILRSAEFDNASWIKTNCTVTANAEAAPDGNTVADRLIEDTSNAAHTLNQAVTITAGQTLTWSVWVRRSVGTRHCRLNIASGGSNGVQANFDLTNGVVSVQALATGTGSAVANSAIIERFPGGWFRVSVSGGVDPAATSATAFLYIMNSIDSTSVYTGDGSSALGVWGAQLEVGNSVTSYIPTTSATVTRAVESATVTGSNFTGTFKTTVGVMYMDVHYGDQLLVPAVQANAIAIRNGTGTSRVALRGITGPSPASDTQVVASSSTTWDAPNTAISAGTSSKLAARYQLDNFAYSTNGGAVQAHNSLSVPSGLDTFDLAHGLNIEAVLKRVTYWDYGLTDAELQSLTTSGPGAIDYDGGFVSAMQMDFKGDVPSDWGKKYNVLATFESRSGRYCTVEIDDADNTDGYTQIARLAVMGALQPVHSASYQGYGDGRNDLSEYVLSEGGRRFGTARKRLRRATLTFPLMTQVEADEYHEIQDLVGTLGEVLFVPDPDDLSTSQRYGGIGFMNRVSPINYPFLDQRETNLEWEEKV